MDIITRRNDMARKIVFLLAGFFLLALTVPRISCAETIIEWDAATGEVIGYKIYYGTSSGSYTSSKTVGNVTQYPLSNLSLTEGATYYFVVKAYNDTTESDASNEISYEVSLPIDTTPPLAPQGISAQVSDVSITLNWQANSESDLSGYRVYYGNSSRSYGPSIPAGNVTSYSIDNLVEGEMYYLAVSALDSTGNESGYSVEVVETIPSAPVEPPPAEGTILEWDAATGDIVGYKIYYGTSPGSYPDSKDVGNVTQYPLSNLSLADGTIYYFVVKAYTSTSESDSSNELSYSTSAPPDTTLPAISITSPTSGSTFETGSSSIDLSGSASDNVGVSQVSWANAKGGSGTASGTASWSIAGIQLSEGDNALTITAEDAAGNQSTDTLTVAYTPPDTTVPVLTIQLPTTTSSYSTESSSVDLSGIAVDNIGVSQVTWVNSKGGSGTASGTASWSISGIQLAEGNNELTITAKDAAGNQYSDTLTVAYTPPDTINPEVSITSPTSGSTYETSSFSIDIYGTSSDNTGVSQVLWNNDRGGSDVASGTTEWSIAGVDLAEGDNLITVTATDAAGNQSTDTLTATYIPPDTIDPVVSITIPTSGNTYTASSSSINVSGDASDDTDVSEVTWINDRGGSGTASGTTSWWISNIQLSEGDNVLTVTAEDTSGNQSTDTLMVAYIPPKPTPPPDTTAPVVTIKSPTSRSKYRTKKSSINLSGRASDNVGVSQVTWVNSRGGSGTASGATSWSISNIQLSKGENILTVTAKDAAGNQSTDTLRIIKR
jgi:hypothetical protein